MSKNGRIVLAASFVVIGMFAFAYAAFPLYRLFCEKTGYGGAVRQATLGTLEKGQREMTVRFDSEIEPGLQWDFAPKQPEIKLRPGEPVTVYFTARNNGNKASTGMATFNVTPLKAAKYFNKVQCFCFNQQTLAPHQYVEMPVTFYIDSAIEGDKDNDDVETMTLSYTFYTASGK